VFSNIRRSRDIPGNFLSPRNQTMAVRQAEEALSLGYLPAPARDNKWKSRMIEIYDWHCTVKGIPRIVICRRPGPYYGGYMEFQVQNYLWGKWNYKGLSKVIGELFNQFRKDKALWRTFPKNRECYFTLGKGYIPFCDADIRPVVAAWNALKPLMEVEAIGSENEEDSRACFIK